MRGERKRALHRLHNQPRKGVVRRHIAAAGRPHIRGFRPLHRQELGLRRLRRQERPGTGPDRLREARQRGIQHPASELLPQPPEKVHRPLYRCRHEIPEQLSRMVQPDAHCRGRRRHPRESLAKAQRTRPLLGHEALLYAPPRHPRCRVGFPDACSCMKNMSGRIHYRLKSVEKGTAPQQRGCSSLS